jgi:hypothetical protein
MARNASRIKLGYYPLPQKEGTRLRTLLDFAHGASAVDPCAGTGAALHQLTEGFVKDGWPSISVKEPGTRFREYPGKA